MRFLDAELVTIPACAPATPRSEGKTFFAQRLNQSKPGHIDRCGITQRLLRLCRHVWIAKFGCSPVPFGDVAVMATEYQIGYAIRSSTASWHLMIEFKCRVTLATIYAFTVVLLQQIRSHFPAREFPSLVLDANYLWVLHQLHIKLDLLHLDPADGNPSTVATDPDESVANA
jgi:hypothetical protein